MIRLCGFPTEQEARRRGNDLVQALLLTGAKNVRGVKLLEEFEVVPASARLVLFGDAMLSVAQPPDSFANQLTEFVGKPPLKHHQRVAAELINDVSFQTSSETRFLLGIIAIETLCATYPKKKKGKGKKRKESNSEHCQRIIRRFLDKATAAAFAPLYTTRNDFVHEGKRKGALAKEADQARQIATDLLLAQIK